MSEMVRIFQDYEAAQQARAELVAAGLGENNVELKARIDEAGPTRSNFTVGNDPKVVGGEAYSKTFAPEGQQDTYMMIVRAADAAQARQAEAIMARYGAISGDPAQNPPGRA
jgi:hypothetical protein